MLEEIRKVSGVIEPMPSAEHKTFLPGFISEVGLVNPQKNGVEGKSVYTTQLLDFMKHRDSPEL
jgi:hypothetical protein